MLEKAKLEEKPFCPQRKLWDKNLEISKEQNPIQLSPEKQEIDMELEKGPFSQKTNNSSELVKTESKNSF